VRDYLRAHGVADYQLVDSLGATEGTIRNLTAEAVADITSTGETLRANHLKILDAPPVLQSQATLFAALTAPLEPGDAAILAALRGRLA
jgi:ATP phosphoribosyltransferase